VKTAINKAFFVNLGLNVNCMATKITSLHETETESFDVICVKIHVGVQAAPKQKNIGSSH